MAFAPDLRVILLFDPGFNDRIVQARREVPRARHQRPAVTCEEIL